jgi:hypothetical protein
MAGRTARSEFEGTAAQKESCSKNGRTPRRRLPKARPVAVQDAAMARRKAPHLPKGKVRYLTTDAPSRRAIPSLFARDEMEYGVPGAAKNTGGEALARAV